MYLPGFQSNAPPFYDCVEMICHHFHRHQNAQGRKTTFRQQSHTKCGHNIITIPLTQCSEGSYGESALISGFLIKPRGVHCGRKPCGIEEIGEHPRI
jgi:hypothetical protein